MTSNAEGLTLIYTETGALVKRRASSEVPPNVVTSLGPWPADELISFLEAEYPYRGGENVAATGVPTWRALIGRFLESDQLTLCIDESLGVRGWKGDEPQR